MTPVVRLAVAQLRIDIDDPQATRQRLIDAVGHAVERGAELVVLPELTASGYVFRDAAEAMARAEPRDGDTVGLLQELSARHHMVVIGGFCERGESGRAYNSAVVVEDGAVLAFYRKTHLWARETQVFAAGDEFPPVVSTRLGSIAVMICYDLEFPELVRDVALRGAQLVVAPSNWPVLTIPTGERPPEVIKAQASAAVNRIFVAVCDRVGAEREQEWIGGSVICDVQGYPVAGPQIGAETVLIAEVDLERALDKSLSPWNDAFADRRPELYPS